MPFAAGWSVCLQSEYGCGKYVFVDGSLWRWTETDRTLRFRYQKDGSLKVYSYQYSQLGNTESLQNVFVLIMQKMRNI